MLSIFKHSFRKSGILNGAKDCHSHILWGVDDGFRSESHSLEAIEKMKQLGIKELWLTPHIMEEFPNSTESLKQKFDILQQKVGGIELHLGAEYMLDDLFKKRLKDKDVLLTDGYLLVEATVASVPFGFHERLFEILEQGYKPLLAHPERYRYLETEDYQMLYDMDVRMQLNYPSLIGIYGKEAKIRAEWLLKEGFYSRIGSDLHRQRVLSLVDNKKCLDRKTIKQLEKISK